MDNLQKFWESVKNEEVAILATGVEGSVTMRTVSPVYHENAVLITTSTESRKYKQMKANPHCCLAVGGCFMEATPEFNGATMKEENSVLRDVYAQKFHDAFDEGIEFGAREADFILLKPHTIKGWGFSNGESTGPFQYDL